MFQVLALSLVGAVASAAEPTATIGMPQPGRFVYPSYSADGAWLVVRQFAQTIAYDPATNKTIKTIPCGGPGHYHALSPDKSHLIVVGPGDTADVYDLAKPTFPQHTLKGPGKAWAFAYSPDGKTIATGHADGQVLLWDSKTGKTVRTLAGLPRLAVGVAFSPDGKALAANAHDSTALVWDVASGRELAQLADKPQDPKASHALVAALAFDPSGKALMTPGTGGRSAVVWDVATWKKIDEVIAPEDRSLTDAVFSPDGRQVAIQAGTAVSFWDRAAKKYTATIETKYPVLTALAIHPTGKSFAVGTNEGVILVYALPTH